MKTSQVKNNFMKINITHTYTKIYANKEFWTKFMELCLFDIYKMSLDLTNHFF